jgi:hypothetical protein
MKMRNAKTRDKILSKYLFIFFQKFAFLLEVSVALPSLMIFYVQKLSELPLALNFQSFQGIFF